MKIPPFSPSPLAFLAVSAAAAAIALSAPPSLTAATKLPAIFSNNMVLQRDMNLPVWGWDNPGQEVLVEIAGQRHKGKTDKEGKWKVTLDPLATSVKPLTMTIQGSETVERRGILVGEVWLCSGQSNMQLPVNNANDPDLESATADNPRIRLITVPQVGTQEIQDDFNGKWLRCTPETVKDFSAVGYFFGRQLHQALNVPIGLIDNAWGGSAAEAWVRRDLLEKDPFFKPLIDQWVATETAHDWDALRARHTEQVAEWEAKAAQAKAEGKPAPPRPRPPSNILAGQHRPGNLYAGVLHPVIGYGIRGAIWYQGETNAPRAWEYRTLFPLMIRSWREEWSQGDFPFYWVQLADFKDEVAEPADSDWAELREAQTMTMSALPNTGEAVIVDLGEASDIHPKNKQDVAKRLARWALARDYGIDIVYRSPIYKSMETAGNKIALTFEHVGGGLDTFDVREPVGFAIAGADRKFVRADAKIVGNDRIEVSSAGVAEPAAVRYAWANNPVCNVQSKEGLRLTPFRTDDWPMITKPQPQPQPLATTTPDPKAAPKPKAPAEPQTKAAADPKKAAPGPSKPAPGPAKAATEPEAKSPPAAAKQ